LCLCALLIVSAMDPDGYGRLKEDSVVRPAGPSYGLGNFNSQQPQAGNQPAMIYSNPQGSQIGVNVPLQVGFGGYNQQISVPVMMNTGQYGPGGQILAQQLAIGEGGHLPRGSWSDTLFDCADSWLICCLVIFCPCIRFGMTINRALPESGFFRPCGLYLIMFGAFSVLWWIGGVFLPTDWLWIPASIAFFPLIGLTAYYRTQLRTKYDIMGTILWDFIVNWFCLLCAMAQEARHVDRDYAVAM